MSFSYFLQKNLHQRQLNKAVAAFKINMADGQMQVEVLDTMVQQHHEQYKQHQSNSELIGLQYEVPERPNELLSKVTLKSPVQKYSEESTATEEEWLQEVKKCENKTKQSLKGTWGYWRSNQLKKQHEMIAEEAFRAYESRDISSGDHKLQTLLESIETSYFAFYNKRMQRLLDAQEPISPLPKIVDVSSQATNVEQELAG